MRKSSKKYLDTKINLLNKFMVYYYHFSIIQILNY